MGFFNIHSVAKLQGGPFGDNFFSKKCLNAEKTQRWERKEKPFWFSSPGQQVHFGDTLNICRTFGRTILVTETVSKKTLTESHDYSRLFSQEKRRLKKEAPLGHLPFRY